MFRIRFILLRIRIRNTGIWYKYWFVRCRLWKIINYDKTTLTQKVFRSHCNILYVNVIKGLLHLQFWQRKDCNFFASKWVESTCFCYVKCLCMYIVQVHVIRYYMIFLGKKYIIVRYSFFRICICV